MRLASNIFGKLPCSLNQLDKFEAKVVILQFSSLLEKGGKHLLRGVL